MSTKRTMRELAKISGEELTLGGLLFSIRQGEEMSQVDFSAMLGVSKQYLCDLEKGRRFASPGAASHYAEILGYSSEQFVRLCFQDMLDKEGIELIVDVKAA